MSSACRHCRRGIVWGITAMGKRMPLDPALDDAGNVATYRDGTGEIRARVLRKGEQPEPYERLRMAHFATCPRRPSPPVVRPDGTASLAAMRDRRRRGTNPAAARRR